MKRRQPHIEPAASGQRVVWAQESWYDRTRVWFMTCWPVTDSSGWWWSGLDQSGGWKRSSSHVKPLTIRMITAAEQRCLNELTCSRSCSCSQQVDQLPKMNFSGKTMLLFFFLRNAKRFRKNRHAYLFQSIFILYGNVHRIFCWAAAELWTCTHHVSPDLRCDHIICSRPDWKMSPSYLKHGHYWTLVRAEESQLHNYAWAKSPDEKCGIVDWLEDFF